MSGLTAFQQLQALAVKSARNAERLTPLHKSTGEKIIRRFFDPVACTDYRSACLRKYRVYKGLDAHGAAPKIAE
ncbi:hypothetical protein CCP4SC76_6410001 [Gammaproteobacteria bacterium]